MMGKDGASNSVVIMSDEEDSLLLRVSCDEAGLPLEETNKAMEEKKCKDPWYRLHSSLVADYCYVINIFPVIYVILLPS